MGIKRQSRTDDNNSHATEITSGLNRRQFLRRIGISAGTAILASQGISKALAASPIDSGHSTQLTKDDLPTSLLEGHSSSQTSQESMTQAGCITPTIETRLFASSNVGGSDERNQLALDRVACAGFKVENPAITNRQYLRFAGTDSQRASDFQNLATGAIAAPKLLLGVRGGYGAMRILPMVDWATLGRVMKERGTILAGFSDVTAIQCALLAKGSMSSLAAPMLYSEFGKAAPDKVSCQQFVEVLTNPNLTISIQDATLTSQQLPVILTKGEPKPLTGTIWGGNLSVVSALAGSEYLPRIDGGIVFLEDVGEQAYRIERMLYDLYLAGMFKGQQAIVFGALSGAGEDSYDKRYDVATVIRQLHELTGLPIYSGMPFGHIGKKYSFPLGATCQLSPNVNGGYQLAFTDYPTIKADAIQVEGLWQTA
ncbi:MULTISPECIES: LD-carboxypeptidase [Psychrobacter]|uniref:LD-carboxypeptidase n=1 Tax=Psychrobacter TaxID=497 RepID=UPI000C3330D2|nr:MULTISPECIES: LD-carboxypeptidase [Psychrobacter]MBA6244111.1 LD-carboxypeptidase [Psychrobacter sp. Urea-trap-18]MBA6285197.1 LD-carboxypeptidase [Psychrobacter sp. Urea-trap-16]MBA6319232.1 LD-carboxypeptidase [Psychrobacter sp. Urea-trap-20]MBA6333784.1 LD-carboxypeptidase [Psychrobacter sp. Urea-trap-19]PKG60177.1 LD-carboxypeptidase [Psychrobacter sp. Choline-3u-12]